MVEIVLLGAGRRGAALFSLLHGVPGVRVAAVVDPDPSAPGRLAAVAGGVPIAPGLSGLDLPAGAIVVRTRRDPGDVELPPGCTALDPGFARLLLSIALERARLHRALNRRREALDVVLASTHDAMIAIDQRGRVQLMNPAAERLTGLEAADVIGRKAADVIPNTRLHVVLETGQAELNQQQDVGRARIVTNRVPVRSADGRVVGAVAVFRDITEVRDLAAEVTNLREVQTTLQAIIDATQDAISVVDEHGNGMLINPAYTRLTGLSAADVIGKPATVDIAEGESMHMQVLRTRQPVRNAQMKVGPMRKRVVVDVAPILVGHQLKGSVGVIHDVSEIFRLTEELERVRLLVRDQGAKFTFEEIVAVSPLMAAAVEQARRTAETPATVLLRGESGVGKELFAHAIHGASSRAWARFVRVNCAALTESLLESELFGYVEGAFTGARRGGKRGLFEEAQGGTIFLDEVGDMSPSTQAKLLRVLQEKEIVRVGDNRPVPIDVRVIGATNANLEERVRQGLFREDLYYRLNVVPIVIPPLRHRRDDIPKLVERLIRRINQEFGRAVEGIEPPALERLLGYDWPGNVRELENAIGRAMIAMRRDESHIGVAHLPQLPGNLLQPAAAPAGADRQAVASRPASVARLADVVAEAEAAAIRAALLAHGASRERAARALGISPRNLYYKLKRLRLDVHPARSFAQ